jgi:thiamine-phosphate pyrophosphorylase
MNMKLIVITHEELFAGEAELINKLFWEGLHSLHLRKPHSKNQDISDLLSNIIPEYRSRIVLHEHFNLVYSFGLKGIHLNKRHPDRPSNQQQPLSVSRSCHLLEEAESAVKDFDYVFLSPIFDSISKTGYMHAFSPKILTDAKNAGIINHQVMALGGIDLDTIPIAADYGFGGVAVLGSLWQDFPVNRDERALLERYNKIQNLCDRL